MGISSPLIFAPIADVTTILPAFPAAINGGQFLYDAGGDLTKLYDVSGMYLGALGLVTLPSIPVAQPLFDSVSKRFLYSTATNTYQTASLTGAKLSAVTPLWVSGYRNVHYSYGGIFYELVTSYNPVANETYITLIDENNIGGTKFTAPNGSPLLPDPRTYAGNPLTPTMIGMNGGALIKFGGPAPFNYWSVGDPNTYVAGPATALNRSSLNLFGPPMDTAFIDLFGMGPAPGLDTTFSFMLWNGNYCVLAVGGPGGSSIRAATGLPDGLESYQVPFNIAIGKSVVSPMFPLAFTLNGHSYAFAGIDGILRLVTIVDNTAYAVVRYSQKDGVGNASHILFRTQLQFAYGYGGYVSAVQPTLNFKRSLVYGLGRLQDGKLKL